MKNRIFSIVLSIALFLLFTGGNIYSQSSPDKKDLNKDKQTQVSTTHKMDSKDKKPETVNSANKNTNTQKIDTKGIDTKKNEMTNVTKENKNKMNEQKHNKQHTTTTKEKEKEVKSPVKEESKKQQIK